MRNIRLSEVTLKRTELGSGAPLSFREKIEIAKLLDRLQVSVIELSAIRNPKVDYLLVKSIASAVQFGTVAIPIPLNLEQIGATWDAIKEAKHPRLQVAAPMSPSQLEYFCHKKPDAMVSLIEELVRTCRELCPDVEFIAGDATRAEKSFLHQAIEASIRGGAATVTICEETGELLPDEYAAFLSELRSSVPALANVSIGVCCNNTLHVANACTMAAIRAGAAEVKTCVYGEDAASLSAVTGILQTRGDAFGASCGIRNTELRRIVSQILRITSTSRSKQSPFDNGGGNSVADQIPLSAGDDYAAVSKAIAALGYDLSEEDCAKVFESFQNIVKQKETLSGKELETIVASVAMQVPPTYRLESYVINTGNIITSTAMVKLLHEERTEQGLCVGDGPIDAAFLAIEQIIGHHYELDDFQIQSVTEGHEAMGETIVRLRENGKLYAGRGISTDIIGASIRAYIAALNKIVYEEAHT